MLEGEIDKICFPFHRTVVARVILCAVHLRLVSTGVKVGVNEIFDACYYGICLHIFFVLSDPSFYLRITSTKVSDNSHKWGIVETISQAMVGDGFKDFGQVGGEWGNAISWREECHSEEPKLLDVNAFLEHPITDICQKNCKFLVDDLPIL